MAKTKGSIFGWIVAALAFVVASNLTKAALHGGNPQVGSAAYRRSTPMERAVQRKMASISKPERHELDAVLSTLSGDEVRAKGLELARLGTRRLPDILQVRRIYLLSGMLNNAPEDICARISRGTAKPEDLAPVINSLDSASLDEWVAISITAMQAQVRGDTPAVPTNNAALEEATQVALRAFSNEDAQTIAAAFDSVTPHPDTELCAVGRLLYGRITALPRSRQSEYARALTIFEASGQDH